MSYKKHNEKLIAIYKKFLEVRYREKGPGELANYKWYKLPNNLPIVLMAYSQMLSEHSQELSNSINKPYPASPVLLVPAVRSDFSGEESSTSPNPSVTP